VLLAAVRGVEAAETSLGLESKADVDEAADVALKAAVLC